MARIAWVTIIIRSLICSNLYLSISRAAAEIQQTKRHGKLSHFGGAQQATIDSTVQGDTQAPIGEHQFLTCIRALAFHLMN